LTLSHSLVVYTTFTIASSSLAFRPSKRPLGLVRLLPWVVSVRPTTCTSVTPPMIRLVGRRSLLLVSQRQETQLRDSYPDFRHMPRDFSVQLIERRLQAEGRFGKGAYTLPVMNSFDNFAYLNNGWQRPINSDNGLPNYYTWLNAWNSASGTVRQGFSHNSTRSV